MTLSAQNTTLPFAGANIRPPQPEPVRQGITASTVMEAVNLLAIMKPVCGPDDGSDAGPWQFRAAALVDGLTDKRLLRAGGL